MDKIRIIHIVSDDKFIDGPLNNFDKDDRFENKAVMIIQKKNYQFKYIKNTERIKLLYTREMVKKELGREDYDAVFFYSLTNYKIFRHIPKNKIVIWWAWGFDIYGPERFIDIPLFKPKTEDYLKSINYSVAARIKNTLKGFPFVLTIRDGSRKSVLRRLDYFQPVIHTEFELMQKNPGFNAKEFYYPKAHSFGNWFESEIPSHDDNVIIGHSATYTNNHLDVWNRVKDYIPKASIVYFPINYGRIEYADFLTKSIQSKTSRIEFLKDFLPKDDYFKIVDSCSYAIYGVLREAAMGNIYRCLAMGVKLFLYKDSVPYKYLSDLGCVVFAIEDIDENSFKIPLTKEQALKNRGCLIKEREMVDMVSEKAIAEMMDRIS